MEEEEDRVASLPGGDVLLGSRKNGNTENLLERYIPGPWENCWNSGRGQLLKM